MGLKRKFFKKSCKFMSRIYNFSLKIVEFFFAETWIAEVLHVADVFYYLYDSFIQR